MYFKINSYHISNKYEDIYMYENDQQYNSIYH